jgi:hypothetical protein
MALGAMALEAHQNGELDEENPYTFRASVAKIMGVAAEAAETERELALRPAED